MEALIESFHQLEQPNTYHHLRDAVHQLSMRGMVQSATWAAEILSAVEVAQNQHIPSSDPIFNTEVESKADTHVGADVDADVDAESDANTNKVQFPDPQQTGTSRHDGVTYTLAKSFFDTRQYRRVAHVLRDHSTPHGRFLRMYATYLAGERRKEEERMELADWSEPDNIELPKLRDELELLREAGEMDAHLWYLFGVLMKRLKQNDVAVDALVRSLSAFPCNHGAWLELAPLCETRRCAELLKLPMHWMRTIFIGSILNDTEGSEHARHLFEAFVIAVPTCRYALLQLAISLYHMRLFDEAQTLFDDIYAQDEFCLDGVDIYSNILYVKEDKVQLSVLANKCVNIDKFRLETCCVIGNYYSLRGQHDQALSYFQRALRINRNYLSAWTLMGHEFLEMRNTAAAVEAYRRAVDINPKDFRAWYGLGQTYELLNMPMYTLYYYQKASGLRPRDARMWCAVAQTLQELRKWDEAIGCYERAVGCDDREGTALSRLGSLYEQLAIECQRDGRQHERVTKCLDQAARYYEANLRRRDGEKLGGQQTAEALRYLAEYSFNKGDMIKAREYGKRLLDFPGHDKDFLKGLLGRIHSGETHL